MNNLVYRKITVIGAFVIVGLVFIARLFYIQVLDESYVSSADNQALRYVTKYPARGIIYDRNHEILVLNQAAYDLMIVPRQVGKIDTEAFCVLLDITKAAFEHF
jgi:penicillin-binding protein 2